jgi:N-methylhydantoinase B
VTETEQPLQITAYEFIQDAMGPGKFRGGAPFRREYKLLAEQAVLQVRSDRRDFRPFGLYGGGPGRPSMNYLNPDRNSAPLASKLTMTMRQGDLFRHEVAGGGGWGDPLQRDPALVLNDVLNEFVSERAARDDYGVVLSGDPLVVDEAVTAALRNEMRKARSWSEPPVYNRGTALTAE